MEAGAMLLDVNYYFGTIDHDLKVKIKADCADDKFAQDLAAKLKTADEKWRNLLLEQMADAGAGERRRHMPFDMAALLKQIDLKQPAITVSTEKNTTTAEAGILQVGKIQAMFFLAVFMF